MEQSLKTNTIDMSDKLLNILAVSGWLMLALLLLDAFLNNARLITWLMAPY